MPGQEISKNRRHNYSPTQETKRGGPMKKRDLKYIGIASIIGGIMLFLDGLGSLILPANYHDFCLT